MEFLEKEKKKRTLKGLITRAIIIVIVALLLVGLYSFVNLFLRYWFLSVGVVVAGLIYLARIVGTALMFPGAFSYFRRSIEMACSTDMSKSTHMNLMYIEKSCESILRNKDDDALKYYSLAEKSVEWIIGLFGKFKADGSLSERKVRLLTLYQ